MTPANDNRQPVRMVRLLGTIGDEGFTRAEVPELLRVPVGVLREGAWREPDAAG